MYKGRAAKLVNHYQMVMRGGVEEVKADDFHGVDGHVLIDKWLHLL